MFLEVCRKTEFSFLSPGCGFIVPKYKKERKILSGEILQRVKIIAECFAVYEYDRVLFIEICADKGVKSKECSLFSPEYVLRHTSTTVLCGKDVRSGE